METRPNTVPPVVPDATIQDVQLRGLARWSPRRAGVPPLVDWWPTYFLVGALALLAVLVAGWVIVEVLGPFAHVLAVAGVATVITFALAPLVGRLSHVMPRGLAVALIFFATVCVLFGIGAIVVWQLASEGDVFTRQVDAVSAVLQGQQPLFIGPYPVPVALQQRVSETFVGVAPTIATRTAALATAIITSLIDLLLILVLTFYLLLDARRFRVVVLRTLDPAHRPGTRRVFSAIAHIFGAYIRAQIVVAITLGALVAATMWLLGMPYALFLGLFAALAELIPMLGPWIGSVPALLIALAQPFPTILYVALALLVLQQIEANVLLPRLSAHAVGIHPIAGILALVVGFELGGIFGALFAVPIVGLIWVLVATAVGAWRESRVDLQRRLEVRALGWPRGRSGTRTRGDLRRLRPR